MKRGKFIALEGGEGAGKSTQARMLVSALARWRNLSTRHAVGLYLAVVGGLLVVLYLVPEVRRSLFAVVLIAAIIAELGFARIRRPGVRTSYYRAGIAAKAVAFGEALRPEFKAYAKQVVDNASALAGSLKDAGYDLVTGGTDEEKRP